MDISVTELKQKCLDIVRRVEQTGRAVTITRRGKVVARLTPSSSRVEERPARPWEQLRAIGGRLLAPPEESVMQDRDFEATR